MVKRPVEFAMRPAGGASVEAIWPVLTRLDRWTWLTSRLASTANDILGARGHCNACRSHVLDPDNVLSCMHTVPSCLRTLLASGLDFYDRFSPYLSRSRQAERDYLTYCTTLGAAAPVLPRTPETVGDGLPEAIGCSLDMARCRPLWPGEVKQTAPQHSNNKNL